MRIETRHLGGLAADKSASGLPAAFGDPRHDGRRDVGVQAPGREIVEEEERFGALDDEIVHAHGDQVDTERIEVSGLECELELGADAVRRGDEDRVIEARGFRVEQRAEAAKTIHRSRALGCRGQRLDRLDQGIAGGDIDTGVFVGKAQFSSPSRALRAFRAMALPHSRRSVLVGRESRPIGKSE